MSLFLKGTAISSLLVLSACGGGSTSRSTSDPGLISPDEELTRTFSETSGDIADVLSSSGPPLVAREVSEATWRENYDGSGSYELIDGEFSIEAEGADLLVTIGEEGGQVYTYRIEDAALIDNGDNITIDGPDGYFDLFISGGGTWADLFDPDFASGYARRVGLYFSPDGEEFGYETRSIVGTETTDSMIADLAGQNATATYSGRSNISIRQADAGWPTFNGNLSGDLDMEADFGAGQVSGTMSNLFLELRQGQTVDFSDNQVGTINLEAAAIQKNAFQGGMSPDAVLTADNSDLAVFVDSGTYSGAFYGPNAEEIAGTMIFDAPVGDTTYLGIGNFAAD